MCSHGNVKSHVELLIGEMPSRVIPLLESSLQDRDLLGMKHVGYTHTYY